MLKMWAWTRSLFADEPEPAWMDPAAPVLSPDDLRWLRFVAGVA